MSRGRRTVDDILRARAQTWPEAATPVAHLMMRIFRSSNLVLNNTRVHVAAHGLTFAEFEVLVTLRGVPAPHG